MTKTALQTKLDALAQKTAVAEADFRSQGAQAAYVARFAGHIPELVFIRTALKTAKEVLKDDMPMVAEDQHYESKTSQVLNESLAAVERLRMRDGKKLVGAMIDYVQKIAEKSA